MKNIIKTAALTLSVGAILMSTGCTTKTELISIEDATPELVSISNIEPQTYTAYGRYYTDGTVITDDGYDALGWEYSTDTISGMTPYDAMPVWIGFSDNGTPDYIKDDIILGLVYDRETAIYDELEATLDDEFELERDGNNIRIQTLERR